LRRPRPLREQVEANSGFVEKQETPLGDSAMDLLGFARHDRRKVGQSS
jgi:hypothetical protein